jgi:hydroxymethylglutaryl-CoA reductase
MKMHLQNILNQLGATKQEKVELMNYFDDRQVSFSMASEALEKLRVAKLLE